MSIFKLLQTTAEIKIVALVKVTGLQETELDKESIVY